MRRLFEVVLILQTVGGAVFFAALFVAPLALSIKVLAAVALMFISAAIFILMTNHLASIEGFRVLVDQIARPSEIVESDVLARLGKLQGNVSAAKIGSPWLFTSGNVGILDIRWFRSAAVLALRIIVIRLTNRAFESRRSTSASQRGR